MPKMSSTFHFIFSISIAITITTFFSQLAQSRILPHISKTSVLDVIASIKNTRNVLSTPVFRYNQQEQSLRSSSSLTLELHPRMPIRDSLPQDYISLTLSRLERDAARVRSLNNRVGFAISGFSKTVENGGVHVEAEDLQSTIVSGTNEGSGEYFARLGIGKPPSEVYMVLDTGSDVNWVQCAPCVDCYQQTDPIFDPASSSSYSPLACESQQCRSLDVFECRNDTCLYQVSYGDGSYTVGDFVTESITLGSDSVDNIALGCGHSNEGLFIGAAGLLGLGGGSLSFPSQINATTLSYCLVDRDSNSASTLEFNSPLPPNAVTAPLLRNHQLDTFYYIGLTGVGVGGNLLPIPESSFHMDESGNGGVIVDSGTAITRLPTDIYNSLRNAFVMETPDLTLVEGAALFDTCYDLSSRNSVEVPTVSFHFPDGKVLALQARNYLIPVDSDGTFCFAFAPTSSSLTIIGNVQQQGTRVGFDRVNSLVGFSPEKC